jgi:hypothetical protein
MENATWVSGLRESSPEVISPVLDGSGPPPKFNGTRDVLFVCAEDGSPGLDDRARVILYSADKVSLIRTVAWYYQASPKSSRTYLSPVGGHHAASDSEDSPQGHPRSGSPSRPPGHS